MAVPTPNKPSSNAFSNWLLHGQSGSQHPHKTHAWWKVMCLTGVDYFSTLGYQPSIAALAAGALSPLATLVLVLVTLFGALPMYRRVALESPHGDGSISMLARLLDYWPSKFLVLALIGFAATGFIITITLSAADAAAHIVENPFVRQYVEGKNVPITLGLIALLGLVFLNGFNEAIGIAVALVILYISLSLVVGVRGLMEVFAHPNLLSNWTNGLFTKFGSPLSMIAASLLVFPKLALGLSGFETGVVVMPLVTGNTDDDEHLPKGRIENGKKLLTAAALLMSVMLLLSSFVTTVVIPPELFQPGQEANGRALAYMAHHYFGDGFGTLYDISTILILWFAGASAMAGLLNIVPRYLPRYGMAPAWTQATRPLVLIFTFISFVVTVLFKANVDAQGAAYATGVLALMLSAAVAVTLSYLRDNKKTKALGFGFVTLIFIYTILNTILSNTGGLKIALIFIAGILLVSIVSRITRSTELRVGEIALDSNAEKFLENNIHHSAELHIIANKRQAGDWGEYQDKEMAEREDHHIDQKDPVLFFEVEVADASEFAGKLQVRGVEIISPTGQVFHVLRATAPATPNAIAAFLLYVRDRSTLIPHCYFTWSEITPLANVARFLFFGEGDTAPMTREIIRQNEVKPRRRPRVHVG